MKKYTRIIHQVYDMQKSCLKCRPFALFQNFRGFGSKMKKDLFSQFLIFQTCNVRGSYNHFYQDESKIYLESH